MIDVRDDQEDEPRAPKLPAWAVITISGVLGALLIALCIFVGDKLSQSFSEKSETRQATSSAPTPVPTLTFPTPQVSPPSKGSKLVSANPTRVSGAIPRKLPAWNGNAERFTNDTLLYLHGAVRDSGGGPSTFDQTIQYQVLKPGEALVCTDGVWPYEGGGRGKLDNAIAHCPTSSQELMVIQARVLADRVDDPVDLRFEFVTALTDMYGGNYRTQGCTIGAAYRQLVQKKAISRAEGDQAMRRLYNRSSRDSGIFEAGAASYLTGDSCSR